MAEIKKINTELQLESALRDGNGSPGTNGQVLSSTGTATDWISLSEIQGVDGTGTANYISKWSDTDTITNSIIFDNGTNVGIGTTSPTKKLHVNGDAFFQNTVSLPDNAYVGLGSSFDFHLVHNGSNSSITNSTGNLNISSNGGDAVFNTSSSERMRITSAGNVGIGTTSPGNKLHVEGGNIQLSDNQHITWGFGGNNAIYGNNTSDFIKIFTNGAERLIVNSSGNIGIGTTSPSQKLDVAGSINLTGNVFSDQGFYGNRLWNSDNTALRFATNNTERMRISSSGNVGVGTTTPTEKLEVAGNVKLDGDNRHIYFGGNNTFIGERSNSTELELRGGGNSSAQTVYIDNSGRIGVGTSNPTNKLQLVYTDTHTSGDLALANSAFDIYNDSTADVAGKGSTLTFSDNYLGTNKTTRAAIKGGTDTAGNTADGFLAFYTDSGGANSMQQRMIIDNDGNVGIGNTNPTKELEIGTNAVAETEFRMHSDVSGNYFNIQSAGNFTSVKTTGSQNFILDSSGSSGYVTFVTNASERMRVNYNGNVGIGTTSPLAKLHIKDGNTLTSALANTSALVEGFNQSILQIASHSTGYSQIAFGDQDDGFDGGFIYSNASRYLAFEAANAERMRITSNGNVGIGTTSPTGQFQVHDSSGGNITISGTTPTAGVTFGTIDFHTQTASGGIGAKITATKGNNWISGNLLFHTGENNSTSPRMIITSSGSVGIGTTSPSTKLHVSGGIKLSDNEYLSWDTSNTRIVGQSGYMQMQVAATDVMRLTSSGNVGIGTTSPARKLEVYNSSSSMISQFRSGSGTSSFICFSNTGSTADQVRIGSISSNLVLSTNYTEKMRITLDGKVGIGTTNPLAKLQVSSTTGWGVFTERGIKDGSTSTYSHSYGAGNAHVLGRATIFESSVTFSTLTATSATKEYRLKNASDKLTLASVVAGVTTEDNILVASGANIGIGTASPSQKLHVDGDIRQQGSTHSINITGGGTITGDNHLDIAANNSYLNLRSPNNSIYYRAGSDHAFRDANGSNEYLRIKTSGTTAGNVGIGTTSPTSALHVVGTQVYKGYVKFENTVHAIRLDLKSSSHTANIYMDGTGGVISGGGFLFNTPTAKTHFMESGTPKMSIISGNVGIGTTTPSEKLVVQDGKILAGHTNTKGYGFHDLSNFSYTANTGRLSLVSNGLEAVSVDSSQKVGIGTTSPSNRLEVVGSYAAVPLKVLRHGDYGNVINIGRNGVSETANIGYPADSTINLSTAGSEKMRITSDGKVGIGTSNPTTPLHIKHDAPSIRLEDNTSSDNHYLTGNNGEFRVQSTGYITIRPGNTVSTRFDANGNVGIGTTAPSKKLEVNGQTKFYEHSGAHLTNQATSNFNFDTLANNAASYTGGSVGAFIKLTGTPPGATGVWSTFRARAYGENAKGNTSGMITFFSEYRNYASTNAVTLGYHAGLYVNPLGVGGLATVTNNYGVYLNPGTAATNNYGVYQNGSSVKNFFQGNVGIGTSSPSEKFEVSGARSSLNGIKIGENNSDIQFPGNGMLNVENNDWLIVKEGALEVMRAGGAFQRVGIGITSPNAKLNVNGSVKIESTNPLYFGGSTSVPNWEIKAYGSGGNDLLINDTGTNSGDLIFTGQDFGVGTTNPLEKLHVSGEPHPSIRLSSSSDSNYNVVINCGYRNEALNLSVGGYKVFTTEGYNTPETTHLYSNNSKALSLASNQAATFTSTVTATNFINSSDERLKENIEKVCNNSLDVQWKTFEFKSDRGQKRYGVIAQELEKTNPEFVREDAEGFKSVAYIDLLIAKIAELEERIQTLENK